MKKRNEKAYLKKSAAILISLSMLIGMNPGKLGTVNADEVDIGDPPVPAAAIFVDGEVKDSYATVPEAFAAVSDEETIKLYEDYTVASGETLSLNDEIEEGGVFLDLNGHTFTVNGELSGGEYTGISIKSTTPGVFNSSGNVNISLTGYTADTFNITGGTIEYFDGDGGTINISGGEFTDGIMIDNGGVADVAAVISGNAKIKDLYYQPNSSDDYPSASLTLSGGYYDVNPSTIKSEDATNSVTLNEDEIEKYEGQTDWEADEKTYPWRIVGANSLSKAVITEIPDQLYTGDPIEPALTVKMGEKTLEEGKDYTVSYKNNIRCTRNYKAAKAIVTGMGDYSDSNTEGFNIVGSSAHPVDITNAEVEVLSVENEEIDTPEYGKVKGKVATLKVGFDVQNGIKRYFICPATSSGLKAATGASPHVVIPNSQKAYWEIHTPGGTSNVTTGLNGEKITQSGGRLYAEYKVVNPDDDSSMAPGFAAGEAIDIFIVSNSDDEEKNSEEVNIKVPFDESSVGKKYDVNGEVKPTVTMPAPDVKAVKVDDISVDSDGNVTEGKATFTVKFKVDSGLNEAEFYAEGVSADGTKKGLVTWPMTTIRPQGGSGAPEDVVWKPDSSAGANSFTYTFSVTTLPKTAEQIIKKESDGTTYMNGLKEGDKLNIYATGLYNDGSDWKETEKSAVIEIPITKDSIGKTFEKADDPVENKKSLKDASIEVKNQTYTGSPLTPAPVVKIGNEILKEGTDYTVVYKNNINAGKGKAVITGKGNYTDEKEVEFTINKANNSIKVSSKKITVKAKKIKKKNYSISAKKAFGIKNAAGKVTFKKTKGKSKITVNKKTGKVTVKKKLKKGKYTVRVKITAAGDANHKKVVKNVKLIIVVK